MWPFRLLLGPLTVGPGEILALLSVLLVAALIHRTLKSMGVTPGGVFDLALGTVIGGAIGARLFYSVPLWIRGVEGAGSLVAGSSEGSAFYGGLLGGLAGCALVARFKKLPILSVWDALAYGMPLAFATGKLGCFLAGCCYGLRCGSPPGVAFAPNSLAYRTQFDRGELAADAAAALPVHPTQLYEMAMGFVLFGFLFWFRKRTDRPGEVTLAYLVGYSIWRFAIEFFRDDPGRDGFNAGISDSQVAALVFLAVGAACWAARRRPPASSPS